MEENFSSIVESCNSCNTSCDPWNVRQYEVLYEGSKIHDQNKIILCYVCSKIAKYAQQFMNNLQMNREVKPNVKPTQKPIIKLSVSSLEIIEISGNDTSDIDTSCSEVFSVNSRLLTENQRNVKVENWVYKQEIHDGASCDEDHSIIKKECSNEEHSPRNDDDGKEEDPGNNSKEITRSSESDDIKDENSNKDKQITVPIVNVTIEEYLQEKIDKSKTEGYLNSQFKCADCVLGFFHKINYLKHMEKHSESAGQYECELCKQRLNTKRKLQHHLKIHTIRYKCIHCNLLRNQSGTIREHLYSVHKIGTPPKVECDKCYMVYNRQSSLRKHIKAKHTPRNKVPCTYCQKIYSTLDTLKRHMILKHPDEVATVKQEKSHVCQECGAAFRTAAFLKTHRLKHSDRRDYYCVECDKAFKSETGLKTHLKTTATHLIYSDLPLACTQCDKRFTIKRHLDRHVNTVHLNIRPFQCDQCTKAYSSVSALKEHKKIIHEGNKRPLKYQCEFCDKAFSRIRFLKAHTRTHTGERPYQCDKCQATFTQSSSLATHNKLVHLKLTRNGKTKL